MVGLGLGIVSSHWRWCLSRSGHCLITLTLMLSGPAALTSYFQTCIACISEIPFVTHSSDQCANHSAMTRLKQAQWPTKLWSHHLVQEPYSAWRLIRGCNVNRQTWKLTHKMTICYCIQISWDGSKGSISLCPNFVYIYIYPQLYNRDTNSSNHNLTIFLWRVNPTFGRSCWRIWQHSLINQGHTRSTGKYFKMAVIRAAHRSWAEHTSANLSNSDWANMVT